MDTRIAALMLTACMALASCGADEAAPAAQPVAALAPSPQPPTAPAPSWPQQLAAAPWLGPGQIWPVTRVTCRQLLAASDRDRSAATLFYYGYLAARAGLTNIEIGKIDGDLRRVMDRCARMPDLTLTNAFQETLSTPPRWFWETH